MEQIARTAWWFLAALILISKIIVLSHVAQARNSPTAVIITQVGKSEMVDKVEALGTLRANESVTLTAQVTEIITSLNFSDGQRVEKGQVLAEMTSSEELAQLQEAEATLREAKGQLDRAMPLARQEVTSQTVLAERRKNYETAVAKLEVAKSRIADRRVRAPFSGVVGLRRMSVGALVEPGTTITTVDDDSLMKLDFTIPATFLTTTRENLPIIARAQAFGDRTFEGKVTGVDSRIDPVTRSITVRAIIPNPDGVLKAGALMTVDVLKNQRTVMAIPEQTIIARGKKTFVFIVDPKSEKPVAIIREVKLGARRSGAVEILSGLKVGEYVITDGTLRVSTGKPVRILATDKGDEPLDELLKQNAAQSEQNKPEAKTN